MADYQIMSDATVDFSDNLAASQDIVIIPMIVEMDGTDYIIGDKKSTISTTEFYRQLDKGAVARTAQVTANTYYQYFEAEFREGRDVLLISFSSGLSKSFEASLMCAQKIRNDYPERKLYCIDSLCATGGHGLLVYSAAQKQKQGMSIDELAAWVEGIKGSLSHWFTVDELDTLYRGGRVSRTSAALGSMLSIKPIIYINGEGKLIPVNKVRGRRKSLETMAQTFRESWIASDDPVVIGYGTDIEGANTLKEMITADGSGPKDIRFAVVGPVIGAHTGPTIVALFYFSNLKERLRVG